MAMNNTKNKSSHECITRNVNDFDVQTKNIYKSVVILAKRSDQIATEIKTELQAKIAEYAGSLHSENLDEVFENREQIEIAKYYEAMPKPSLLATQEFIDNDLYFRDKDVVEE
ncbi:hypothetical protein FACS1894201_10450 [Bacteroidia bacterium]|nr:hypothetical protein FACS1894201_10450 [Bacteroidia bacterium]